ncbi:D-inositol 3-phosphate glycosyltransferase [Anaerohalosphaera lusitana]|uniref:D-inositol 3-phosphate glycosyltransferase n=2 Tax=Anaerohalosphaera lusitana TaxID=1936003 RepID=A0A1U9NKX1_9BACT|nr:D-inositol 3-phosphate glycosyltransferase [Anaerohalosphaera lusitana]
MLGWEFPPFISGGLGTACYGLTKAMSQQGTEVLFALPKAVDTSSSTHVKMLSPRGNVKKRTYYVPGEPLEDILTNVEFRKIESLLEPYSTPEEYHERYEQIIRNKRSTSRLVEEWYEDTTEAAQGQKANYGEDMYTEVHRYAYSAARLAAGEDFDLIHAHDWMTYPAGIAAAAQTGKPLVIHVHSTEFDRSGEHVNQLVYDIERAGMHAADRIIAVSHLTRNIIISRYGVEGEKVEVVYNGVERNGQPKLPSRVGIRRNEKIVLFLGRITMQKGPEYFLHSAKKVLSVMPDVKFVMAGSGDMMEKTIEMAAELGIGNKVLFTGFLRGPDVQRVYEMADLYVMPSVSEPFGIAPLEALNYDVPVLISKQSGVSEVLTHALKVDFWDTDEMANKILAVLKYRPLQMTLKEHGNFEVRKLKWEDAAAGCNRVYQQVVTGAKALN